MTVAAAGLLKALGDPTRLRLALLLARNGEMCVCHLVEATGGRQYSISRHLAVLRSAGVVSARREGTWMHYRLAVDPGDLGGMIIGLISDRLGEVPAPAGAGERAAGGGCCRPGDLPGREAPAD